jgi:hypothetical protein
MVNRFMEVEVKPVMDGYEKRREFPRELVRKAGEAGLYGAVFPESVGGSNMGYLAACVIQEETVRNDVRFASCNNQQGSTCPSAIYFGGTPEQIQKDAAESGGRQDHWHDVPDRVGRRLRRRRQYGRHSGRRDGDVDPHHRPGDVGLHGQRDRCGRSALQRPIATPALKA